MRRTKRRSFCRCPSGGGQIHGHAPRREGEAGIDEGGADAFAAFFHGAGWEADDGPRRQPARGVDFDGDVVRVDAEDRGGVDGGEHGAQDGHDCCRACHPARAYGTKLLRSVRRGRFDCFFSELAQSTARDEFCAHKKSDLFEAKNTAASATIWTCS